MQCFKTKTNAEDPFYIAGVGMLGPKGKGGVLVEEAAKVMSELQEREEDGSLVLDDNGVATPLEGKALNDAAKDFADARGIRVVKVSEEDVPNLKVEAGALPEPEDIRELSLRLGGEEEEAVEKAAETGVPQPTAADHEAGD